MQDYTRTDVSLWFTPVSPEHLRADPAAADPTAAASAASVTSPGAAPAASADADVAPTADAELMAPRLYRGHVDAEGSSAFLSNPSSN